MEEILLRTYSAVLSVVIPALLGYIAKLLRAQRKERAANSRGTMLLLRVQLIEYHDKYMERGYIPSYAYQNFTEMYEAYHNLGGNGMVTHMKEDIEKLEIRKEKQNV